MKISIITVTLNNKAGLLRAIESVRSQTYKNVEHIIVDGGSTDGTLEMLREEVEKIGSYEDRKISPSGRNDKQDNVSSRIPEGVRDLKISPSDRNDKQDNVSSRIPEGVRDLKISPSGRNDKQDNVSSRIPEGVRDLKISPSGRNGKDQGDKSLLTTNYSLLTISEADTGIYDAINKGIKLATGDVIGLLHSDDFYANEFVLERYAEVFEQNAESKTRSPFDLAQSDLLVEAVYSDLVYVKDKVKGTTVPFNLYPIPDVTIRYWKAQKKQYATKTQRHKEILNGWMPPHPTLFLRKEVFEKFGFYRTDMKIASDYEMILRLFYEHNINSYYLPITTYCMTIGGASNKSLKNILRKSSEDYRALRIHRLPFPLKTLLLKNLIKLPQFFRKNS